MSKVKDIIKYEESIKEAHKAYWYAAITRDFTTVNNLTLYSIDKIARLQSKDTLLAIKYELSKRGSLSYILKDLILSLIIVIILSDILHMPFWARVITYLVIACIRVINDNFYTYYSKKIDETKFLNEDIVFNERQDNF